MHDGAAEKSKIQTQVTQLLADLRGDGSAISGDRLFSLVYDELRRLANLVMDGRGPHLTLQPTALVHEAWIKLVGNLGQVNDKPHFFAVAAKAMRQVLADHARSARAQKRGGEHLTVSLRHDTAIATHDEVDLVALHEALEQLTELEPRHARVVELRAFGMLTIEETAEMLGVSPRTVKRDWKMAQAWLSRALDDYSQ